MRANNRILRRGTPWLLMSVSIRRRNIIRVWNKRVRNMVSKDCDMTLSLIFQRFFRNYDAVHFIERWSHKEFGLTFRGTSWLWITALVPLWRNSCTEFIALWLWKNPCLCPHFSSTRGCVSGMKIVTKVRIHILATHSRVCPSSCCLSPGIWIVSGIVTG